jgi:hypothetical protein
VLALELIVSVTATMITLPLPDVQHKQL